MTEVSPFPPLKTGPIAKCPKCGDGELYVHWHDAKEISVDIYEGHDRGKCAMVAGSHIQPALKKKHVWVPEHMHRTCRGCRYEWAEAPLT